VRRRDRARAARPPVKLRLDRDDDFLITGRRHCFHYEYEVGYDDDGRILGAELTMVSRAGFSADLSGPVMTRAICHFDNAYWLPDVAIHGYSGRTNTQSNTAFRGFGGPQGAIAVENILDSIARALGKDRSTSAASTSTGRARGRARRASATSRRTARSSTTTSSSSWSPSSRRRAATARAARDRRVQRDERGAQARPRADARQVRHLVQPRPSQPGGALVHVYGDGSVLVNHGGTEMGQGLNTKVAQVVAHELGVDIGAVRVTATDTQKIANTSATAASTGSDLNGKAAQDAARRIKARLVAFAAGRHGVDAATVASPAARSCSARRRRSRFASSSSTPTWRASSSGPTASTRRRASRGTARRCRAGRSTTSRTARR
jgi:xanthine dehydrogenase large subunit